LPVARIPRDPCGAAHPCGTSNAGLIHEIGWYRIRTELDQQIAKLEGI
jgi:hypothetical protein